MAAILSVALLPVEAKGLHHGGILDGEENGLFFAFVGMLMPGPWRDDKEVTAFPVKALAVND